MIIATKLVMDESGNLVMTDQGDYVIGEPEMVSINPTELSQNMMFFDINYLCYYKDLSGSTFYNTDTVDYAIDDRSDKGYFTFNTMTGAEVCFVYDTSTYFYIKDFFILNHNFQNGSIAIHTGTGWYTITTYAGLTTNAYYYSHATTLTAYGVSFKILATQDDEVGKAGELIATLKKFQLNLNPDQFTYADVPINQQTTLRSGKTIFSEIDNVYVAKLHYEHLLGDFLSMAGSDLQNLTELSRQRASFLFWPNAYNLAYPDMWGMRPQDMYRCKFVDAMQYDFPEPSRIDILRADFTMKEV